MKLFADGKDITEYSAGMEWKNSLNEVATTFTFSMAKNLSGIDADLYYYPQMGSIVSIFSSAEILRGLVVGINDGDKFINSYTAVDFGWYLKSKETYQFDGVNAKTAITGICNDFNIPVDDICEIDVNISKIYLDKSLSAIIRDILSIAKESTGSSYNLYMTPIGLKIHRIGDIVAVPKFKISNSDIEVDSLSYLSDYSHKSSIDGIFSSVKVITGSQDSFMLLAHSVDKEMTSKYGNIQEVIKIDEKKVGEAKSIAENKIRELRTKSEEYGFSVMESEDAYTRSGYIIRLGEKQLLISSCQHSYNKGQHTVKMKLSNYDSNDSLDTVETKMFKYTLPQGSSNSNSNTGSNSATNSSYPSLKPNVSIDNQCEKIVTVDNKNYKITTKYTTSQNGETYTWCTIVYSVANYNSYVSYYPDRVYNPSTKHISKTVPYHVKPVVNEHGCIDIVYEPLLNSQEQKFKDRYDSAMKVFKKLLSKKDSTATSEFGDTYSGGGRDFDTHSGGGRDF